MVDARTRDFAENEFNLSLSMGDENVKTPMENDGYWGVIELTLSMGEELATGMLANCDLELAPGRLEHTPGHLELPPGHLELATGCLKLTPGFCNLVFVSPTGFGFDLVLKYFQLFQRFPGAQGTPAKLPKCSFNFLM